MVFSYLRVGAKFLGQSRLCYDLQSQRYAIRADRPSAKFALRGESARAHHRSWTRGDARGGDVSAAAERAAAQSAAYVRARALALVPMGADRLLAA